MADATIDGVRLHYTIDGSGPNLVFIHGLGSRGQDWSAQIQGFRRHYRVIAVDLRGHGESERVPGPYSIPMLAADVSGLLEHLGVGHAHIVGISMGGAVAYQLALDASQRVRSLTVVNILPEVIARSLRDKLTVWQRFVTIWLLGLPRLAPVVARRLFPDPADIALREQFATTLARNDEAVYLASLRALLGWSVADRLDKIQCPTLVVAADQDYTPVAEKAKFIGRQPLAKLVVIPNARHAVPVERPETFNRILGEFLGETEASIKK